VREDLVGRMKRRYLEGIGNDLILLMRMRNVDLILLAMGLHLESQGTRE
jgi:hypothetical protein